MPTEERQLLAEADRRALAYLDQTPARRVFPDAAGIAALGAFDQPLPEHGQKPEQVLTQLDEVGSPATVASTQAPQRHCMRISASVTNSNR